MCASCCSEVDHRNGFEIPCWGMRASVAEEAKTVASEAGKVRVKADETAGKPEVIMKSRGGFPAVLPNLQRNFVEYGNFGVL